MNETLRICGAEISNSEIRAGAPQTRFSTPGGSPASKRQGERDRAAGVSSDGLSTAQQPAASAAPTLRAGRFSGKPRA
ncbi:MAG: hypothetical protein U1F11_15720 [Steroidobacteraceae bacterium]